MQSPLVDTELLRTFVAVCGRRRAIVNVTRHFVPYWSQLASKAAQQGAAREVLNRAREEGYARHRVHARAG